MSHISQIKIQIKNLTSLKKACERLNLQWSPHQKTYQWYNSVVDEERYPLPEGITIDDLGKCDHAIKIPDGTYEIGVVKQGNKYILVADFWERQMKRAIGKNGGKIIQAYSIAEIKRIALQKRYRVTEKQTENGIRLTLAA